MPRSFLSFLAPADKVWVAYLLLLLVSCRDKNEETFPAPIPEKPDLPYYLEAFFKEPATNPGTREGIELGKALFFEKALSRDYTVSCSSCHDPAKGFADGNALAKGINGRVGRRNAPGLYNVGIQTRFFWDGRDSTLEQQSLHPIQDSKEMDLTLAEAVGRLEKLGQYPGLFGKAFGSKTITTERMAKALAQYERSLVSDGSKYDRYLKGLYTPTNEEKLGMQLFFQHPDPFAGLSGIRGGNCGDCHLSQTLTGRLDGFEGFHNTGLTEADAKDLGLQETTRNPADFGKFKTPGLRNIALTAPYMHDGRFKTLEEVIDHYNSEDLYNKPNVDILILKATNQKFGQSLLLNSNEKKAILSFLHMLTDSTTLR
jgi:cytochrome c peroxidase